MMSNSPRALAHRDHVSVAAMLLPKRLRRERGKSCNQNSYSQHVLSAYLNNQPGIENLQANFVFPPDHDLFCNALLSKFPEFNDEIACRSTWRPTVWTSCLTTFCCAPSAIQGYSGIRQAFQLFHTCLRLSAPGSARHVWLPAVLDWTCACMPYADLLQSASARHPARAFLASACLIDPPWCHEDTGRLILLVNVIPSDIRSAPQPCCSPQLPHCGAGALHMLVCGKRGGEGDGGRSVWLLVSLLNPFVWPHTDHSRVQVLYSIKIRCPCCKFPGITAWRYCCLSLICNRIAPFLSCIPPACCRHEQGAVNWHFAPSHTLLTSTLLSSQQEGVQT